MIRLLIYGLGFYVVYKAVKSWTRPLAEPDGEEAANGSLPASAELIKDPQCGAYFLRNRGVEVKVDGEWLNFCSPACRDEYLRSHGQSQ